MRLIYFTAFGFSQASNGEISSSVASSRYRILLPGQILTRLGFDVEIRVLTDNHLRDPVRAAESVQADIAVVAKLIEPRASAFVAALKRRGIRIVVDFCDDHFAHPMLGPLYRALAASADQIVCNTEQMVDRVRGIANREAVAVFDPVEGRKGQVKFLPCFPALKCVWYGFPTNLPYLFKRMSQWMARGCPYPLRVEVITEHSNETAAEIASFNLTNGDRCILLLRQWSSEAVWHAIEAADIVLLPSEVGDATRPKSANRLMEAIYGGRLALATMLPSYLEFQDYCETDQDPKSLALAVKDPFRFCQKVEAGQEYIETRYLPLHAALSWSNVLRQSTSSYPLKLNLGCGDKILSDYINVDIVQSRAGFRPDVLCDLRRLKPFKDASVDEILSVHVVEHFWRWEVRDTLLEWKRVLKGGGKIILECPNLEAACRTFLEDPIKNSAEDAGGQRTMWVFYGDPQWRDPYMVHRWGYTPESLKALLLECGYANVRQEPAQYKLREPRDMRIVGEKPF
jgi:SAM-dependent methyltransferase